MNKSTDIDIDIYETLETINVNPNSIETNDDVEFNDLTEVDEFIKADIRHDGEDVMKIYTLPSANVNIFSPQIEIFAPCSAHVDASRTNMSAKQLLQLVLSTNCDIPFIINKNYRSLTDIPSTMVDFAMEDGHICYSNYDFLIVYYPKTEKIMPYYVPKYRKLVNNSIELRYLIGSTDDKTTFKKGDMIYDYTGQVPGSHIPKIGYRVTVGFAQFFGYTADDGFVMSASFAEKARISYSRKIFLPISKEIIYKKRENGRYFYHANEKTPKSINHYVKVDNSDSFLREVANTTDKISKLYGKHVVSEPGGKIVKIKVHKLNKDKSYDMLESEYIYTRGMIEEIVELYEEHSKIKIDLYKQLLLAIPKDQALSITNKLFEQYESTSKLPVDIMNDMCREFNINQEHVDIVLEIDVLASTNTTRGDKFANTYAGKGVCSLIIPDHLMPGGVDILFNPLGIFGRNNWGTMFELGLSKIIGDIELQVTKNKREETLKRLRFVADKYIKLFDEDYRSRIHELADAIESNDNVWTAFKLDYVKHNGLYLFVDTFPGVTFKTFMETFIYEYENTFKINITKKEKITYSTELMQWMRDKGFLSSVFDKNCLEEVTQEIYIGKSYWIKLYHTSLSKFNALGMSKSYSTQTGDPSRGAKNGGGQHMSWQTIAALIGHQAAIDLIKEFYAVKSSAVLDKNNYIQKMIKDGEYIMKDTYYSPTTTTLNCYLAMIFMRYQGFEPAYIDRTIKLIDKEKIILDDDQIELMIEDLSDIETDIQNDPDKYDFEEIVVSEETETEIGEEEDVVLRIDDLFEEGCLEDLEDAEIGLENDLE